MFEDALVESGGKLRTHRGWSSGVAAMCNFCVACLLLLLPLLHPLSLPKQALSTLLAAPAPPASTSDPYGSIYLGEPAHDFSERFYGAWRDS
jgi:protein TonB